MAEGGKYSQLNNEFDDDAFENSQLDVPIKRNNRKNSGRGASDPTRKKASENGKTVRAGVTDADSGTGRRTQRNSSGSRANVSENGRRTTGNRAGASTGRASAAGSRSTGNENVGNSNGSRTAAANGRGDNSGSRNRTQGEDRSSENRTAVRRGSRELAEKQNDQRATAYSGETKENPVSDDIIIISVALLCILMVLSYCGICGPVGVVINIVIFGLFGRLGYVLPFLIFFMTVFFVANKEKNVSISKFIYAFLFLCMAAGLIQMIGGGYDETLKLSDYFTNSRIDIEQLIPTYGGILGGVMVSMFCPFVGKVATVIILIALTLILFVLSTGKAFITYISRKINKKAHNIYENRKLEREERKLYQETADYEETEASFEGTGKKYSETNGKRRRMGSFDVETGKKKTEQEPVTEEDYGYVYPDEPGHLSEVTKQDHERDSQIRKEEDESLGFLDRLKNRNGRKDITDRAAEKKRTERNDRPASDSDRVKSEELQQIKADRKKDNEPDSNGFAESELEKRFADKTSADKPSVDLINLRKNPNPIKKPTTRQYFNTDEDNNIVRMPVAKRLHAGSSNLDSDNEAVSYRIHGSEVRVDNRKNVDIMKPDYSLNGPETGNNESERYTDDARYSGYAFDTEEEQNDRNGLNTEEIRNNGYEFDTEEERSAGNGWNTEEIHNNGYDLDTERDRNDENEQDTEAVPATDYNGKPEEFRDLEYNNSFGNICKSEQDETPQEEGSERIFDIRSVVHRLNSTDNNENPAPASGENIKTSGISDISAKTTEENKNVQPVRDSSGAVRFTDMNAQNVADTVKIQQPTEYRFPPVSLLSKSSRKTGNNSEIEEELEDTIKLLQRTFESFGVGVTVTDASVGPTVTRYEILPNQGVKVKQITGLSDDIKLALAAPEIRLEAPIPGKSAVGIEVPNKTSEPVLFGDLVDSDVFRNSKSKISFAVGKDISGESIVTNIGSMPHALIAGATGSGKSVCINALIMSILYKAKPSEVKMIMVDPKRVELVGYNGIPHLLVPVVTDVKKASGALNWALAEMDNRYQLFADNAVTNLASYNKFVEEKYHEEGNEGECPDKLPQILIIIDELNDLMMTANSKEVEAAICRLTQLARACGIHVILATQRPSVNVLTGTIKANIPTRIAFSVSSIVDSRTILDQQGAEKLLGKGDMLFYPAGYVKPVRVQGVYVSDDEVKRVVTFIKDQYKDYKYSDDVSRHIDSNSDLKNQGQSASAADDQVVSSNGRDEYFNEAGKFIIEKQKASIGSLQRVYKIGFNRAARIMDQLADAGVVGPEEGTKPRKILMTLQEFEDFIALDDR